MSRCHIWSANSSFDDAIVHVACTVVSGQCSLFPSDSAAGYLKTCFQNNDGSPVRRYTSLARLPRPQT